YITHVAKIYDLYSWLQLHFKIGIYTAHLYSDTATESQWRAHAEEIKTYHQPLFAEVLASIRQDKRYLDSVKIDPQVIAKVKAEPILEWYWVGLTAFEYM